MTRLWFQEQEASALSKVTAYYTSLPQGEKKETDSGPWCGYLAFRGCCCVCLYRQDSVYIVAWQVLSVASVWDLVKFVVDVYLETST